VAGAVRWFIALRDCDDSSHRYGVGGLAHDAADDLLVQFNDGPSSWDGRVW
jgi:hypothetical protein